MKRILLLSTGGTIASRPGADGLEPEMSGQELLSCLGDLSGRFQVEVRQIMSLDSSNVQAEEWKIMARSVYETSRISTALSSPTAPIPWPIPRRC